MIIPPSSLEVINRRSTVKRRLQLRTVIPPNWLHWKPLIVVGECISYIINLSQWYYMLKIHFLISITTFTICYS